jgi:hypothetical protein
MLFTLSQRKKDEEHGWRKWKQLLQLIRNAANFCWHRKPIRNYI